MARRYINPTAPSVLVTDKLLSEARARAGAAEDRLRAAREADPTQHGWDAEYAAAETAAGAASRRVDALERLRAAQVERSGKREAAVTAAAGDLKSIASALGESRDAVAAAAAEHLRALAALTAAAEAHNQLLAGARARLADAGLAVRDDLVDEGQEHGEGTLDGAGVRAGGVDWTAVPAAGLIAHALRLVFGGYGPRHPLAELGKYTWRSFEVEDRADGLKVPTLKDVGAVLPAAPVAVAIPDRPSIREEMMPPAVAAPSGFYRDPPVRRRA